MRKKYWSFDEVSLNLDDKDVTVTAVHILTCTEIRISFRLTPYQLSGPIEALRDRIEVLATDKILDLASYLERPE